MIIERNAYLSRIRPFIDGDLVKVLTGMRRTGKSVMLKLIQRELLGRGVRPDQMVSLNFESLRHEHLCRAKALHEEILRKASSIEGKVYLFFDEIQEVEDWEKCINSFRVDLNCDIYITGSNARLLSGELATYLAGRYVEIVIYPLSFKEFSELYRSVRPQVDERTCFVRFLTAGGMPYLSRLNYEEEASLQYLLEIFNSVELKDVVKRNNIRDVDMLERLLAYIMAHVGTPFSATAVSKYLKSEGRAVAPETILNYIKACTDAFLFHRVKRWDIQGKKILSVSEKYYISDHGIREAILGRNLRDIQLVLENIVYMELLRRGYTIFVGRLEDKEVDFIGVKANERIYVQVSYLLASEETISREFGVYEGIRDQFPKYVLSMDEIDLSQDGVRHRNIRDFLLADDWS